MRYLRILFLLARDSAIKQTAYRPSLFWGIGGKLLRVFLFFAFTDALFQSIPAIAGWTLTTVPFLIFSLFVLDFLVGITFHRNLLFFFPEWIEKGEYDYLMVRPVNLIFLTSFRMPDVLDIISLLGVCIPFAWYLAHASIGAYALIGYAILMIAAYGILFAFALAVSAINFWTYIPTGIGRLYESIGRLNRFPLDALPKFWRIALFYVVPVAVAGNIPAKFLIGTWSWAQLLYIVAFAAVIFAVAVKFWYFALTRYQSAA